MTTNMEKADAYIRKQLSSGSAKYMPDAIASYNEHVNGAQAMLDASFNADFSSAVFKVAFVGGYVAARLDAESAAVPD
ncbi:hypothetical protein [Curtobacterium sp. L1-20]|uniref:hypothetical protein n=1 Tax=Curtobacterium sp. L1-20 TaxID=3138181 RepID=UPI003B52F242